VNSQGWLLRSVDAANNAITYSYDSFGNLLSLIDPASNTTTMQYDLRGRKTAMHDPDSGWVYYRYDTLGELVWQKDAKNQETTLTYDLLGRLIQRVELEGTTTWVYDTRAKGIGRLAEVQGLNGYKESYTYDTVSRLAQTTYIVDAQTFVMANSYDTASRVDTITYPGGFAIRNVYNQYGYLSEVRRVADNALYWQANTLNARGQLEKATLGNGLITNQQFNPQTGLLNAIQTGPASSVAQTQNLAYVFDAIGNLSSRADKNQNLTEAFAYDALNRLTSAQVTGLAAQTMQYNALGNITFKSDVGSYTYGQNGAGPHAVTAISGGISANFTYDANGNRISSNGGTISYTSFNLPTTLRQGNNQVSYVYGPDHDRYKRTVQANNVTTTTLMIGSLYEKETVGALTTNNYYIPAGGRIVAIQKARSDGVISSLYLLRDHLGSIDTVTDTTGKVVERDSYDAWGKRRTSNWRSVNVAITSMVRRGYTGHEQLDEVGLIHMNGRVYDPTLGRFLSPDPGI
jgi:RHS repeat-associated protein